MKRKKNLKEGKREGECGREMGQGGEEISSPGAASLQLPGCSWPCGHHSVFWEYLLLDQFSAPWDGVFHSHINEFVSARGLDLSGNRLGSLRVFWWSPSLSICLGHSLTPLLLLHCPEEENWLRKVFPYLCTAPSFQAHPGPI